MQLTFIGLVVQLEARCVCLVVAPVESHERLGAVDLQLFGLVCPAVEEHHRALHSAIVLYGKSIKLITINSKYLVDMKSYDCLN